MIALLLYLLVLPAYGLEVIPPLYSKILFIYNGELGDFGWTYQHNEARNQLNYKYRDAIETDYVIIPDDGDADALLNKVNYAVDLYYTKQYRVFVGASFGFQFGLFNRSSVYPDARFVSISGYLSNKNMITAFGKIYQALYLEGLLAGYMSKAGKVCFMSLLRIPETNGNVNAFAVGLNEVNPNATLNVAFTLEWYNPELEAYTAQYLFNKSGCDYFAQHSDTLKGLRVAADSKVYSNGYNSDVSKILGETVLTSAVWNWFPLYDTIVTRIWEDRWIPNDDIFWGIETGMLDVARYSFKVPYNVTAMLDDKKKFLIENPGQNNIFCGPKFNLSVGKCYNDSWLRDFGGPMSQLLPAPFKIKDWGNMKLPGSTNSTACPEDCSGNGICSSAMVCICNFGWNGTKCQNSYIALIGGGIAVFLIVITLIVFRKRIKRILTGNFQLDGEVDAHARKQALDDVWRQKLKLEAISLLVSILKDLVLIIVEWVDFVSIIQHRAELAHYYAEHHSSLAALAASNSLVNTLQLSSDQSIPPFLVAYAIMLLLGDFALSVGLVFHGHSLYVCISHYLHGISSKDILMDLGIGEDSLENLGLHHQTGANSEGLKSGTQSQVSAIVSSTNETPMVEEPIGLNSTNAEALKGKSPELRVYGQRFIFMKRQILIRSLQVIDLAFHTLPLLVIKFYIFVGFMDIKDYYYPTSSRVTMIADICYALFQVGMMAALPKIIWTLRTSVKLLLLEMNDVMKLNRKLKNKKLKASLKKTAAVVSPATADPPQSKDSK